MLTLALPLGSTHGWGICGTYLSLELARLGPLRLVAPQFDASVVPDEFDFEALLPLVVDPDQLALLDDEIRASPVLQAATDHRLLPMAPGIRGRRNVLYTFFEHSSLAPENLEAARSFDVVVGGSTWCRDVLRAHGFPGAQAIFQGVDRSVFNACGNAKRFHEDSFVVFSGGKFEYRKGQDLVIAAFRIFQQRHDDVLLVNAWFNHWAHSWRTMAASPHIEFVDWAPDHCANVQELLSRNGIDLSRVLTLPPKPNHAMARVYRNSDCGLFPNRCEGGTNLALMEYMACGKAAIVSNSTGHRDVAGADTALMLNELGSIDVRLADRKVAEWDEPAVEEILERLEWAYSHRDALRELGRAAGMAMESFSWEAAARQFHRLLVD